MITISWILLIVLIIIAFLLGALCYAWLRSLGVSESMRKGEMFIKLKGIWYPHDPRHK